MIIMKIRVIIVLMITMITMTIYIILLIISIMIEKLDESYTRSGRAPNDSDYYY